MKIKSLLKTGMIVLAAVVCVNMVSVPAVQASIRPPKYILETKDVKYTLVKKNCVAATIAQQAQRVVIPETVVIQGKTYNVTELHSTAVPSDTPLLPEASPEEHYNKDDKECKTNRKIKTISLPETITKIESGVFNKMTNLRKVKISPKNKQYKVVKNGLYSKDGKTLYGAWGKAKVFCVPKKVQKIGDRAFAYTNFSKIEMQDSCKTIGAYAFFGCKKLTDIGNVKLSEKEVGKNAFGQTKLNLR